MEPKIVYAVVSPEGKILSVWLDVEQADEARRGDWSVNPPNLIDDLHAYRLQDE